MTDPQALALIERAGAHYAARNTAVAEQLTARGLPVRPGDGMSLWVPVPAPAADVAEQLRRRGWQVRTGDEFLLEPGAEPSHHLRLTVHPLDDAEVRALADDVSAAVGALR
jgi:DNA-binding transcriptional MocR family regulator